MSAFKSAFEATVKLSSGCGCGRHATPDEHASDASVIALASASNTHASNPRTADLVRNARADMPDDNLSHEDLGSRLIENAVMRALFPHDATRRRFIKAVGSSTALAAVSSLFPPATAKDAFAQNGRIEKPNLKIGFIPITCATPIIMSQPMGFYGRQGLNVDVVKTAGWAVIRDKTINKEYDAAHMLSPMPLAITLGVGAKPIPYTMQIVTCAITRQRVDDDLRDLSQASSLLPHS